MPGAPRARPDGAGATPPRAVRIGWLGKVPTVGDFVARNVTPELRARLDDWLARSIARSRDAMGEDWLPAFLEAPVWRFVLHGAPARDAATLGLMIPSVDRVGRYFPFLLLVEIDRAPRTRGELALADDLLTRVEPLAMSVLDPEFDLDAFEYEASRLTRALRARDASEGSADPPPSADPDATWWWTDGTDRRAPGFMRLPDLPAPDDFAGLLRDDDPSTPFALAWEGSGHGSPTGNGTIAFTAWAGPHVVSVVAGAGADGGSAAFAEVDGTGGAVCATPGGTGDRAARVARFACATALARPAPPPGAVRDFLAERDLAEPPLVTVDAAGVVVPPAMIVLRCRDGAFGPMRLDPVNGAAGDGVRLEVAPGERLLVAEAGLGALAPRLGAHLSRDDIGAAANAIWEEALVGAPGTVRLIVLVDRPAEPSDRRDGVR